MIFFQSDLCKHGSGYTLRLHQQPVYDILNYTQGLVLRGSGKQLLTATASLVGVVWIIIQKQSFSLSLCFS